MDIFGACAATSLAELISGRRCVFGAMDQKPSTFVSAFLLFLLGGKNEPVPRKTRAKVYTISFLTGRETLRNLNYRISTSNLVYSFRRSFIKIYKDL